MKSTSKKVEKIDVQDLWIKCQCGRGHRVITTGEIIGKDLNIPKFPLAIADKKNVEYVIEKYQLAK